MRKLQVLLCCILLAGCDDGDQPAPVQSDKPGEPCLCLEGIGSSAGEPPVLELVVDGQSRLVVCGFAETDVERGKAIVSEFEVFDCDTGKSIARYGATDICEVMIQDDDLYITELRDLPTGKNWEWQQVPLFRQKISAAGSSLLIDAPQTVFDAPPPDQASIEAFLSSVKAKRGPSWWEETFGRLVVCSMAGDSRCIETLENPEASLGVELDGAAAESHQEALALFKAIGDSR